MRKNDTQKTKGSILYLAALLLFFTVAGCGRNTSQSQEDKKPSSIADLHKDIVGVYESKNDDALEIILEKKKIWNSESVVFSLAADANTIAEKIQIHFPKISNKRIRFTISVPLQDKFGNETSTRVLSLNFITAEIMKINYSRKNFLLQNLLNLSEKVWYIDKIGEKLVIDYCRSEYAKNAEQFCQKEINSIIN